MILIMNAPNRSLRTLRTFERIVKHGHGNINNDNEILDNNNETPDNVNPEPVIEGITGSIQSLQDERDHSSLKGIAQIIQEEVDLLEIVNASIFEAIHNNDIEGLIQILEDAPVNLDINASRPDDAIKLDNDYGKALHEAISSGNPKIVQLLLKRTGVDFNVKNFYGETPLHYAVTSQKIAKAMVVLLLKYTGVDVNAASFEGDRPLHLAISQGDSEIVELLLADKRININATNKKGQTPLHLAVEENNEEMIKLLLKDKKININATDKKGQTPLHWAVEENNEEIIKLLLNDNRTITTLKDNEGKSAADLASPAITQLIQVTEALKAHRLTLRRGRGAQYRSTQPSSLSTPSRSLGR